MLSAAEWRRFRPGLSLRRPVHSKPLRLLPVVWRGRTCLDFDGFQ